MTPKKAYESDPEYEYQYFGGIFAVRPDVLQCFWGVRAKNHHYLEYHRAVSRFAFGGAHNPTFRYTTVVPLLLIDFSILQYHHNS